ncbi:MAG TPA: phosphocarrier protein HPr [Bacillus sp. (in: firmicutes)]|nr:phosphocarrier protein HPr [Bacillus sp. (in: firmicutes)]
MEKIYTITSHGGIHARPATLLINTVDPFTSNIFIEYNDRQVNLRSIIGVMSLDIPEGAKVRIIAEGDDEEQVMRIINTTMKKEGLCL